MSHVWVLSRSLSWGGIVQVRCIVCVCVAHDVCVVLGSSLVFLTFCYVMMGSYHLYFITTSRRLEMQGRG